MEMDPKISIITVCLNSQKTIEGTIQSVKSQTYKNIEYIIIDGLSSDQTLSIIDNYKEDVDILQSEKDMGLYDALNKGIDCSTGEVVCILHSDDVFQHDNVVMRVMEKFTTEKSDLCLSNMVIVNEKNRIVRYYPSHYFSKFLLLTGWMPGHPATFITREIYNRVGLYSLDYTIASDFDFFLRVFKEEDLKVSILREVTLRMKLGGKSNRDIQSKITISKEIKRALRSNGFLASYFLQIFRYIIRLVEIIIRPSQLDK